MDLPYLGSTESTRHLNRATLLKKVEKSPIWCIRKCNRIRFSGMSLMHFHRSICTHKKVLLLYLHQNFGCFQRVESWAVYVMVCVICLAYCNIPGGFYSSIRSWGMMGKCYIFSLFPSYHRSWDMRGQQGVKKFFSPQPIFSRKKGVFFIIIIN